MTLADAQAAFRQSPGRETALAYMDAALGKWDKCHPSRGAADQLFKQQLQEIRDWLMNEPEWRSLALYPDGAADQ